MLDEDEGSGPHHVGFVPAHVLREDVGLVDPVPRRGQRHEEGARRPLEPEDHRVGVGRLDGFDVEILALAVGGHPGGWEDDLFVAGLDVFGRHLATVMELHAVAELDRVGSPVLGDRP